jgi:hypothetical protein
MKYIYSTYLRFNQYNKNLDFEWFNQLKRKLNILEDNRIIINLYELNRYLYHRYKYEIGEIKLFDDTKYNLENFTHILNYIHSQNNSGYDADDESKQKIKKFDKIMDNLTTKLNELNI